MGVKLGNGKWAIKEDKLLAYNDNSGRFFNKEFDFSRGSSATYVAKDGLIKTAGLQATNLVNNGDFSELGSELVTNGNFDTDSDWSNFGTPTTSEQSTDKAYLGSYSWYVVATAFRQGIFSPNNFSLVNGKTYKASLWIYAVDGAEILSGVTNSDATVFTSRAVTQGQWTNVVYYFTANASSASYISILSSSSTLEFYVDNVSVKQVDPNDYWTLGTGWGFGDSKVVFSDTANGDIRTSSSVFTANSKYKINLTVSDLTSGTAFFALGDGAASNLVGYNNYSNGDYSFEITAPNGQELRIYATTSSSSSFSITNISVQEIQTDTPRIDFSDSVKGALLLEPQSTNLIPNANQYAGNTVFYTLTSNQSSPDGENNATLFIEKTSTSNYSVSSANASVTGGQTYSYSFFIKYAGKQNIPVNATDGVSGFHANIDILNGVVNSGNAQIKDFGNGWYRVFMTRTVAATASNAKVLFNFGNITGDGESGFYLFGYQIEQLSFSTSYIPTFGSTATRLADVCNNSGSAQDFSESGVLYAEISALADDQTNRAITLSDGTNNNVVQIFYATGSSNKIRFQIRVNGVGGDNLDFTTTNYTIKNYNKIAIKYKLNDAQVWINGTKIHTDSNSGVPNSLSQIDFNYANTGLDFYGKVRELQVFTEALTDEQLQKLTTI